MQDYPQVLAFWVDPVISAAISDRMMQQDHQRLIRRFIPSLKAIIKHDREQKRQGGWVPGTLRLVPRGGLQWQAPLLFFLILNRDAYHMPGRACSPNENLISRISRAWYSALGVAWNPQEPWVHVPKNPVYWIDKDDPESLVRAFYRASYMCKAETKQYGLGLRAFGNSQN